MTNSKAVTKAAGAATVAAPYIKAVLQDQQLRDELRELARSVNHLYGSVSGEGRLKTLTQDESIQQDVSRIVASLQHGARRLSEDARPRRHVGRWFMMALAAGAAIGGTVFFWRSRAGEPST